jgi:hypothetical protein
MAKARPLTNDELAQIRELHAAGLSCGQIATKVGRAKSTISKVCDREGLLFDATRTATATDHQVQNNRQKRATLEGRLLDEAGLLLDQLHQPALVFNFGGKDNTYEEHQLEAPPVADKRALVSAASTAIDRSLKLAEADRAGSGADAGKSMIGALFAALQVTPIEEPSEEQ